MDGRFFRLSHPGKGNHAFSTVIYVDEGGQAMDDAEAGGVEEGDEGVWDVGGDAVMADDAGAWDVGEDAADVEIWQRQKPPAG